MLTELTTFMNLSSLILIKLITSLVYLLVNYITHQIKLPVAPANILRLFISSLDFTLLLTLLSGYILESCYMAYSFSILGILFSIVLCVGNWVLLVEKDNVQSVCTVNILSLIVLLILHIQFTSMGLTYKGPLAALLVFNVIYSGCWLIVDRYPKTITCFMERVGEKLSWIDPFIGKIPHNDLALRNVCSFSLGLVNFTYLHTSGTTLTIFILFLIGLGLVTNVLIGLRLIKASAFVKLHTSGFIGQIMINGYNNIIAIYDQFKNKQLPKATWHAWMIALIMGLNFTSPSYCMASTEGPVIGESLTGEQPVGREEGVSSPTGESREILRRASQGVEQMGQYVQRQASAAYEVATCETSRHFTRDVFVGVTSGSVVAGGGYVASEMMSDAGANPGDQTRITELENEIRGKNATIGSQARTIANQEEINKQLLQKIANLEAKKSWFKWLNCFTKQQANE